jgi:hypothetical protein
MPRLAKVGISRAMKDITNSVTISGTDAYMAPKAFEEKRNSKPIFGQLELFYTNY